jgi:hypothetical protein
MTHAFDDIINGADVKKALTGASSELSSAWSKYQ